MESNDAQSTNTRGPEAKQKSFTPLYHQIEQALRRQIESGDLTPGQAVSERELSSSLGVSRMTARQALSALRDEGLIYSERGRGTFVREPKLNVHTRNLLGFSEDMRRRGLEPGSKIISFKRFKPDETQAQQLKLAEGEQAFSLEPFAAG